VISSLRHIHNIFIDRINILWQQTRIRFQPNRSNKMSGTREPHNKAGSVRELRLTDLDGKPITVNFNFVALRQPANVFPHIFRYMEELASSKKARIDTHGAPDGACDWRIGKCLPGGGSSSVGFNRHAVKGTLLTMAAGVAAKPIEVIQSPDAIDRALKQNSGDIHPAGAQKLARYRTGELNALCATIRGL
jgi:hypothetical protein